MTFNSQPELNFNVHQNESPSESHRYLEAGRKKFSGDCRILFDKFMTGAIINNQNSPVPEFRRRRQDLTDNNGVQISLHSTDGRIKNWWMTPLDRMANELLKTDC